ncbi:MAG: hypothetical protein NTU73_13475 [Ignavibacteriae bacterium]|nr:hypothetical protein [Ignavibacteriota bacterium]
METLIEIYLKLLKEIIKRITEKTITKEEIEFFDTIRVKEKDPCVTIEDMFKRWAKLAGLK